MQVKVSRGLKQYNLVENAMESSMIQVNWVLIITNHRVNNKENFR